MKSILLVKKFLGLVEMTSGLVNASFSCLPERQAVKMISLHPDSCCFKIGADCEQSLRSRRKWVEKGEVNLFFLHLLSFLLGLLVLHSPAKP